jgi:hypothetical protein
MRASTIMGLSLSIGVHVAAAALWVRSVRDELPAPPPPFVFELVELPHVARNARLDESDGDSLACAPGRWIAGIGIEMNERHVVILVPRAYPAFQAGLRLGDVVVNPMVEPDSAGYDAVDFRRKGRLHRLLIKTRQICLR